VYSSLEGWVGEGSMYHVWKTEYVHTVFLWKGLREGDHSEDTGVDGREILKWISKKWTERHELV